MAIEVKLTFTNEAEMFAYFNKRAANDATAKEPEGPKPKAEKKEAAKPEAAATPATAPAPDAPAEKADSSAVLDYDKDIKPVFFSLLNNAAKGGRESCMAIIKQFGCEKKLTEVSPDRYPEVLAAINERLAA